VEGLQRQVVVWGVRNVVVVKREENPYGRDVLLTRIAAVAAWKAEGRQKKEETARFRVGSCVSMNTHHEPVGCEGSEAVRLCSAAFTSENSCGSMYVCIASKRFKP
jgi:hypothetical protein